MCFPPRNSLTDSFKDKVLIGVVFGGNAQPKRTWYSNQLESLKNVMGYYGVIEYMPANAIYGISGDQGGG